MTKNKLRKTIDIKRRTNASEEYARKKGQKLSKEYGFEIIDEFVSDNLHVIMADLTEEQIKGIGEDKRVYAVEDMPRIELV